MFTPVTEKLTCTVLEQPRRRLKEPVSHQLLADVLADMHKGWRNHEGKPVEYFLRRHPQIAAHPDTILRLIYEEIDLRRQRGQDVDLAELAHRFPQWESVLGHLLSSNVFTPPPPEQLLASTFPHFELLEEIGHGVEGRVYLARQLDLAGRLVVLKVTRIEGGEHLSLARLQHTNIVPLFGVFEDNGQRRRALCMPFFGRATLKHILQALDGTACGKRRGIDVLNAVDRLEIEVTPLAPESPLPSATGYRTIQETPGRQFLGNAGYVQAICSIGAALADGLHHAHQNNLVHLDIKPSNVLLTTDGQAMLLDFHLASPCLRAGAAPPSSFGGTPSYMAPEQEAVCEDIRECRPVSQAVDGRADIFGLGAILYEALGGMAFPFNSRRENLCRLNPKVSVGLADIVAKCLAPAAADRYATAEALADDLRRHVHDQPLRGVRNRSWGERWRKWRRRRPFALPLLVLIVALASSLIGAVALSLHQQQQDRQLAEDCLHKGRAQLQQRQFAPAIETLTQGLTLAQESGAGTQLTQALENQLRLAHRAFQAEELHQLAASLRMHLLFPSDDTRALAVLELGCRQAWDRRHALLDKKPPLLEPPLERRLQRDLGDLAMGWADVHVRLDTTTIVADRRRHAVSLLTEAASWGCTVPGWEWRRLGKEVDEEVQPRNAWDHFTLGRSLLRSGRLEQAAAALEKSVHLAPADCDANFCLGVCSAQQERHAHAVAAFSVCVGHAPLWTEPLLHRGRSHAALGDWPQALRDFHCALTIRPNVPEILFERGHALLQLGRHDEAAEDLTQVLDMHPGHALARDLAARVRSQARKS